MKGMNISITTTAKTDAEGLALLKHLGMPFRPAVTTEELNGHHRQNRQRIEKLAIARAQKRQKLAMPASQPLSSAAAARAGSCGSFKLCRICFRKLALAGEVPGVIKASW